MIIDLFKKLIGLKKKTEEHFANYDCKGICHDNMRCVDLPNHEKICTAKELILSQETIAFLKEEIKKEVSEEWKKHIADLLNTENRDPPVRRKCC